MLVAAARQRLLVDEPLLVLAQQHVGVDQRAAAQAAGDHAVDALEAPDVEQAVAALAGLPEVARPCALGVRGKLPGWVGAAALQDDDRAAGLGQPVGRDGAAETRSPRRRRRPVSVEALSANSDPRGRSTRHRGRYRSEPDATMVRHATRLANDPNGPLTKSRRWACSRRRRIAVSLREGQYCRSDLAQAAEDGRVTMSGSGVQFTETMRGFASTSALDDFASRVRARQGRRLAPRVHRDGDRRRRRQARRRPRRTRPTSPAPSRRPALSPTPLTVEGGRFNLLVRDEEHAGRPPDALLDAAGRRRRPPLLPRGLTSRSTTTTAWTSGRTPPPSTSPSTRATTTGRSRPRASSPSTWPTSPSS